MINTYFMKMTEDMYNNPDKYYDYMVRVNPKLRGSKRQFRYIVKEYFNGSRYDTVGVYMYTDSISVCFGGCVIESCEEEIKYITKNLIGGKLL